jgi:tetratricopeptide (TPR) repeat protein
LGGFVRSELTYDAERLRQRRQVQEAEGYLALIALPARWAVLPDPTRDRLATRALICLADVPDRDVGYGPLGHVHYLRGRAYCSMERYADAVRHLEIAARLTPPHIKATIALARCYKRVGRIELAILTLEPVVVADECRDVILYNLACYCSLAQQHVSAVDYLAHAIDLNPAYRQLMAEDDDFEPIRRHPAFVSLSSVVV